jgi:hypothetical protein
MMTPVTYHIKRSTLDSERFYLPVISSLFVVLALGVTFMALVAGVQQFARWDLLGLIWLNAVVFAPMAIRCVRHSAKAENFLRLDADGLEHGRRGKVSQWSWSELADFKVRNMLNFRFLTGLPHIPVTRAGETAWPRLLYRWGREPTAILDDYDHAIEEIAATLNQYRERALAGGPATDGAHPAEPA